MEIQLLASIPLAALLLPLALNKPRLFIPIQIILLLVQVIALVLLIINN